jgi:hypothetical protein
MAVVTRKSGIITNRDASPQVKNASAVEGGTVKQFSATVEVTTGDSSSSVYIMGTLPSNALVSALRIYSDDMGTGTVADIGLYKSTLDGSAVVDADFFASALSLSGGALNGTDIAHESAVFDPDDMEKPIWSALGLSSDPMLQYDVCATLTVAADAGGTLSLLCQYAI